MRLWLLLVAAFSQAMSQLLSDASGMSVGTSDAAFPKDQEVNWPALALAGSDSPGYLAWQPGSTPQSDPLGSLTPGPATDLITADGCASPSPQTNRPPRTKRKLLRERQDVETSCPAGIPRGESRSDEPSQNPRLYPGGAKRRFTDWLFGNPQQSKQCPPEKQTLCCTGAQEGLTVRTCASFYIFPGSSTSHVNCFKGGIYCCDDLVISDRVINYLEDVAIFDRDGENCFPLFYRPPPL